MFNLVTPVYSLVQSSILVIFYHGENRNDGHWSPNTHSIIQLEKISNNFVCLFVRGCWLWAMEVNVLPFPILSLPNPSFFSLPCLWYSIPEKKRKNKALLNKHIFMLPVIKINIIAQLLCQSFPLHLRLNS